MRRVPESPGHPPFNFRCEAAMAGETAKVYKGRLYPLDTKDLEKEHEKRVKAEQEGKPTSGGSWEEFNIPGTSGSGEPQPDKGGTMNDEKSAAKGAKEAEKAEAKDKK